MARVRTAATPLARRRTLALLVASLLLGAIGQLLFDRGRPYAPEGSLSPNVSAGIVFYLLAIGAFSLAVVWTDRSESAPAARARSVEPPLAVGSLPAWVSQAIRSAQRQPRRVVTLLLVAALTLILLDTLRAEPQLPVYTLPFLLWLGAIGLFIRTVVPLRARERPIEAPWWRTHRPALVALIATVLAAFALRVAQVDQIPPNLSGDEGTFGLESIKTITGDMRNPFTTGWLSVPTLSFFFNSLSLRLFDPTVFALRLPWALVGTLTVVVVFQLARRLAGLKMGLMTAALLATYHFHIHYSRLGMNNAADPFLMALVLLLLYRAIDRRSLLDWALCGVAVGLAQYFYFGARFAVFAVAGLTLYMLVRDGVRFWREQRRGMAVMLGAAIITAAPMIQYAIRFPNDFNARVNQIGIFQSGWLTLAQQVRGQGVAPILIDQIQRATLAFNAYPDRTSWYGSPLPLLDSAAGVLFLLGLGYATLRPGDRRLFPMVVWWWGATILGGAFTESPPSSQRLITLAPPAVFFVALALLKIGQIVRRVWSTWPPKAISAGLAAAVLALSLASVNWYFVDFTPLRLYGGFNAVVASELAGYWRNSLGPDWRIYLFGAPRLFTDFGSIAYIAPDLDGVDVVEPLAAPPDPGLAQPDKDAAFVFLPERRAELEWVRQTYPGGQLEDIPSEQNPLFSVYRVPLRAAP